jgi:hypothetical protein
MLAIVQACPEHQSSLRVTVARPEYTCPIEHLNGYYVHVNQLFSNVELGDPTPSVRGISLLVPSFGDYHRHAAPELCIITNFRGSNGKQEVGNGTICDTSNSLQSEGISVRSFKVCLSHFG